MTIATLCFMSKCQEEYCPSKNSYPRRNGDLDNCSFTGGHPSKKTHTSPYMYWSEGSLPYPKLSEETAFLFELGNSRVFNISTTPLVTYLPVDILYSLVQYILSPDRKTAFTHNSLKVSLKTSDIFLSVFIFLVDKSDDVKVGTSSLHT